MPLSIIPNLRVSDLAESVEFYCRVLRMEVEFVVDQNQDVTDDPSGGAFAMLARDGAMLMLQTSASLAQELQVFSECAGGGPAGTTYFRGIQPEEVIQRIGSDIVEKGPFLQWYGMNELYFRDPDSHVICVAAAADGGQGAGDE